MPPSWKNVIVKGTAESISLVEGVAYNCPKDFYAKKITFKKNFSMKTGNGEAAGWGDYCSSSQVMVQGYTGRACRVWAPRDAPPGW